MSQHEKRPPFTLRRIGAWVWRWPFITWAICALFMHVFLGAAGADHDSPPFGILVITVGVWGWMFWAPDEILSAVNGGSEVPYQEPITIVVGLLVAAMADVLLGILRARLRRVGRT